MSKTKNKKLAKKIDFLASGEKEFEAERIVNNLLHYAISEGAESVLIEPQEGSSLVSFNLNGVFEEMFNLSEKIAPAVSAKIKELAEFESFKNLSPKVGKFKIILGGAKIIFSVYINPLPEGDKIILDIYSEKSRLFRLRRLGLQNNTLRAVKRNLEKMRGGIIVLGEFNSGKTSTLYSFLNFLNRLDINIATVEKEIAYDIPLINQSMINIKKGFNYQYALSSVLRQDPDIIMVDDVEEKNAMESFLNFSERGHLSLAGIRTKNILSCLDIFKDFSLPLALFIRNIKMIVRQSLVKKNCPHCLIGHKISKENIKKIQEKIDLNKFFQKAKEEKIISQSLKNIEEISFYKSRGCPRCSNKNNFDSIGIFEVLEMSDNSKDILRSGHFSKLREEVKNQGGFYLEEDALLKAINGIISFEEFLSIMNN